MSKLTLLAAGAVGYVLGARAGRERYEQIARQAQKLRTNPTVQQKADQVRHAAQHAAQEAASTAADKVRHRHDQPTPESPTSYSTQGPGTATDGFGRGDEGV